MIRAIGAAVLISVAVGPAMAQVTEEQITAITAAIEANGCKVTAQNNDTILQAAGLSEADATTVVQALIQAGSAVIEDGELLLKSENCE